MRIGHHEVLIRLASGGAANVFLVRDSKAAPPGRLLALKVLLPHLAANDEFLNMFFTEARIAARLRHRNIVRIAGFGRSGGIHCLAMEYVFGVSLAQVLRQSARARKPLTVGVLLKIAADTCEALHFAHELRDKHGKPMGLVHRDVTPQNILVGFNGTTKLTDFGIAKATNRGWETQAGIVKGKFCYMSPEQALGKKVDRRSDIFGVGIVLWEALTGKELFKGTSPMEVLSAIRDQKIVEPSKVVPGLSPIVDPIVMKALRRSPRQRYQTALEMREDIEELIVRANVTIDESVISREFAGIYGDQIMERAFSLRAAMAGRADLEALGTALGGTKLQLEEQLGGYDEDEYEEDPLGLFGPDHHHHFDDDGIVAALPAAVDKQFTNAGLQAIVDDEPEPSEPSDPAPPSVEDLEDLSSMEYEDSGGIEAEIEESFDGWQDHTKMMEPSDELLAMLSEDDMTIGMVPAEFTKRFGKAIHTSVEERERDMRTADEADVGFGDEATFDMARLEKEQAAIRTAQRSNGRSVPPPPPAASSERMRAVIPAEDTVLQSRPSLDIQRVPKKGGGYRPPPRAPSLDLPEAIPAYDSDPTGRAPAIPLALTPEPISQSDIHLESNPAGGVLPDGPPVDDLYEGFEPPPPEPPPPPLIELEEDSKQILATAPSEQLSAESLLELAQPEAAPAPDIVVHAPAAWSQPGWHPPPEINDAGGIRLRASVLALLLAAVFVLGVAVGVFVHKLLTGA